MTIKCDVLVVGAGPAGLTAALLLSKKGFSASVLEKSKTVGPSGTKYDITEGAKIREILDEVDIKPNKISNISEWFSPNHNFILDSNIEDFYFKRGPDKDSLENVLLEKLKENDVNVFFESNINSIDLKKQGIDSIDVNIKNEDMRLEPTYVIAADGHESKLRKISNIKAKNLATFKGFGVMLESKEKDTVPHAKIYFDKRLSPGGYIYSGSVGREVFFCVVIDNIFSEKTTLKKNLEYFLEKNISGDFIVKNYFGGIGVSGIQKVQVGNVLFIGGAALFYDPFFGYGLNYAIESAFVATQAIQKNNIESYNKYANEIQKDIEEMFIAREIWRKTDNKFFDKLILAFGGEYNKDDDEINKILEVFGGV